MWPIKKKIKELNNDFDELEAKTLDDIETQERKNVEILVGLNEFYEKLLFLSRLFNALGFLSLAVGLASSLIWWPLFTLFVAIAILCFRYAQSKKNLSDCARSFIRYTICWENEIRKANAIDGYQMTPPKPEDFN